MLVPLRRKHGLLFSVSHQIVSRPHIAFLLLRCSSGRVSKDGDGTLKQNSRLLTLLLGNTAHVSLVRALLRKI